jgi:hypothetical protein
LKVRENMMVAASKTANRWKQVTKAIRNLFVTYGVKDVISAETDFGKVADSLKGDGTVGNDVGNIYYYVTQFIEKALNDLSGSDTKYRIVVFIDDLDRCSPDRALEVLESIKSFSLGEVFDDKSNIINVHINHE